MRSLLIFAIIFAIVSARTIELKEEPIAFGNEDFRNWLKATFFDGKHHTLGYNAARVELYNYVDNINGQIECVYSGYLVSHKPDNTTSVGAINCEHTVPQSFFREADPMKSDLCHLYPAYSQWNSMRSNYPFQVIEPDRVTYWLVNMTKSSTAPTTEVSEYSRYLKSKAFQPRLRHSGNLARSVLYFFTMYPTLMNQMPKVGDVADFCAWHYADPVDAREVKRNQAIAEAQGNGNPFVTNPEYVEKAWECKKAIASKFGESFDVEKLFH